MSNLPPPVTVKLVFDLLHISGTLVRTSAKLTYDPREPYAVTAVLQTSGGVAVPWVFDRMLLADGLDDRSGIGDVQFWRGGPKTVYVQLTSDCGWAILRAPACKLAAFLAASYVVVPPGAEYLMYDLDDQIRRWLNPNVAIRDDGR